MVLVLVGPDAPPPGGLSRAAFTGGFSRILAPDAFAGSFFSADYSRRFFSAAFPGFLPLIAVLYVLLWLNPPPTTFRVASFPPSPSTPLRALSCGRFLCVRCIIPQNAETSASHMAGNFLF